MSERDIAAVNLLDGAATRLAGLVARHWCGVEQDDDPQADAWRDASWRAGQDVSHLRTTIRELRAETERLRAAEASRAAAICALADVERALGIEDAGAPGPLPRILAAVARLAAGPARD